MNNQSDSDIIDNNSDSEHQSSKKEPLNDKSQNKSNSNEPLKDQSSHKSPPIFEVLNVEAPPNNPQNVGPEQIQIEIPNQIIDNNQPTEEIDLNQHQQQQNDEQYPLDVENGYLLPEEKYIGLGNQDLNEEKNILEAKDRLSYAHPKYEEKKGKIVSYPICKTKTGCISCCSSNKRISELSVFGMGIVVYFQILKAFAIVFFFIALINIPLIIIYSSNHTERQIVSYEDVLFKMTIGNAAGLLYNCLYKTGDKYRTEPKLLLDCNDYDVSEITAFGVSKEDEEKDNLEECVDFSSTTIVSLNQNNEIKNALNTIAKEKCKNASKCDFDFPPEQSSKLIAGTNYFLVYTCYDKNVKLINDKTISRRDFIFIVVGIDILGGIILLIILMVIPCSHKVTKKYFKEKLLQISDYTLHIEGINLQTETINKDIGELMKHLDNVVIKEKINPYGMEQFQYDKYEAIYDFVYPMVTDGKLELVEQSNKLHRSKKQNNKKLVRMSEKIHESKKLPKEIKEIYVTFTNQRYKNTFIELYSRNKCNRCCLICCCQKKKIAHLYFRNKWLTVNNISDQPSNIVWENVSYNPCKRFWRKLLLWIVSIIILCLPFGLAVGAHYAENELNKKFNFNLDCTKIDSTVDDVRPIISGYTETQIENGDGDFTKDPKLFCYCHKIAAESYSKLNDPLVDNKKVCKEWKRLYMINLGLKIGVIIIVPVFNVIFSILLDVVSKYQRDKTLSKYYTSYMIKSFILQLINTGIILIITNMMIVGKDISKDSPFFAGEFQDMNSGWYSTVGTSILFTMIINIVTPHAAPLLFCIWNKCRVCCDKCGKKETKCKTRKEYLDLYLGPEFNISARYASILTTIFVTLMFSSGMPLLYACAFLFLFITYWVDKILLFRYYQYPPNIDLFLDTYCNMVILFGMVIHFAFGIWMYGNEMIISKEDPGWFGDVQEKIAKALESMTTSDSYYSNAFSRILYTHNILMLIFLAIIILALIYRIFFWNCTANKCCKCCVVDVKKIKCVDIYDAVAVDKLYKIYNLRKARMNILNEEKINVDFLQEFILSKIILERKQIVRKMIDSSGKNVENVEVVNEIYTKKEEIEKDFDKAMPDIMVKRAVATHTYKHSREREVIVKNEIGQNELRKIAMIERDYTYQIIGNDEYKDFAYYYLYLPEARRYKDNGDMSDGKSELSDKKSNKNV